MTAEIHSVTLLLVERDDGLKEPGKAGFQIVDTDDADILDTLFVGSNQACLPQDPHMAGQG